METRLSGFLFCFAYLSLQIGEEFSRQFDEIELSDLSGKFKDENS